MRTITRKIRMKKYRKVRFVSFRPRGRGFMGARYTGRRRSGGVFRLWRFRWLTLLGLVLSGLAIGLCSLRLAPGSYGADMFQSYFDHPAILWLNLTPPVLLILFLWFVLGRAWLSVALGGGVITVLSVADHFKIMFRDDPLTAADLGLAAEGLNMANSYISAIGAEVFLAVGAFALSVLILAVICRANPARTWKGRTAGGLITLGLLVGMVWMFCTGGPMTKTAWNQWTQNEDNINQWSATQVYLSKGFVYPFLHSLPDAVEGKPEGYKDADAQAVLEAHPDADIPENQKVNVVSIMLEGFNDLTQFADIELREDKKSPYKPWNDLEKISYSGRLITNIFAAGTVDTERGHVTGMTDFGNLRHDIWSYARYFSDQGYITDGSHPSNDWFYNRKNINRYLGFDNYYFLENHYADITDGEIAKDDVLMPEIYNLLLEDMEQGKPVFSFNVTYQNHGPYPIGWLRYGEFVPKGVYSDDSYYILNNYLGGIEKTGQQLVKLKKKLEKLDEPVVMMVYGDHNPWLGDGNSVYEELGVNFDLDTKEGFENYYGTRYLIWANDAAKEALGFDFVGEGPDLSPAFLMAHFFDLCGWEGPALTQVTKPLLDSGLTVASSHGVYLYNGRMSDTLPESLTDEWQDYVNLSYYLRNRVKFNN